MSSVHTKGSQLWDPEITALKKNGEDWPGAGGAA